MAPAEIHLRYAGVHRQEDRDMRAAARVPGLEKQFWHMIRVRVPSGTLAASQYLALDALADRHAWNRSLRATAGQSIQLHGLRDAEAVAEVKRELGRIGLAAGCHPSGFEFAIAASPLPVASENYLRMRALASELCDEFYPKPGREDAAALPGHPPKKFTVGIAIPEDNSANIRAHDAGLLLVPVAGGEARLNIHAGGSLSMPGRRPDSYARLGTALGSVAPQHGAAVVRAIAATYRRLGKLARKSTRLKHLVDELGETRFQAEVERELGFAFDPAAEHPPLQTASWQGPGDQQDGQFYYGLPLPFGRIQDTAQARTKSALRAVVQAVRPRVIVAPDQNLILSGLRIEHIDRVEKILSAFNVPFRQTRLRYEAMACAGLPTCPLAIAESERVAPQVLDELEAELERIGRAGSSFTFRISGCSIGCIRPNMVDLGAIGRRPGRYDLYVGGSEAAGQFGELYAENVPLEEIVPSIRPLLEWWARRGGEEESFSEFYARNIAENLGGSRLVPSELKPSRPRVEALLRRGCELRA